MWDVRDRMTGRAITMCSDQAKARELASHGEQYYVHPDRGADYRHLPRPGWNDEHPGDAQAREAICAEIDRLAAAHAAGCNDTAEAATNPALRGEQHIEEIGEWIWAYRCRLAEERMRQAAGRRE